MPPDSFPLALFFALGTALVSTLGTGLAAQTPPSPSPESASPGPAPATGPRRAPSAATSARERSSVVIDNRCGETVVIHFRWRNADLDDRWSTARWRWAPGQAALAHQDLTIRSLARRALIHVARMDGSPLLTGEEQHGYEGESFGFTPIILSPRDAPDLILCAAK